MASAVRRRQASAEPNRATNAKGPYDPFSLERRTDVVGRGSGAVGATFRKGQFRAGFELVKAEGVIPAGSDGGAVPGSLNNAGTAVASFNVLPDDEASGWYVEFGYRVKPKWWLDIRLDRLNSGTDTDAGEREFETITIGTQYYFSKRMRIMFNYEFRDAEAPNLPSAANPNQILDEVGDRLAV